jgi:hypothetical protein
MVDAVHERFNIDLHLAVGAWHDFAQAANEARETAQVIRMSDYHPKKKPVTYPRFRKRCRRRPD